MLRDSLAQLARWRAARAAVRRLHAVGQRRHPPARRPGVRRRSSPTRSAETGIAADSLWLEITETALLADVKAATVALRNLRSLGLHLSVDDFGTGYSSLTYLKRFPVEAIKIDRAFVAGLGLEAEDTTIVEAVVNLGHSLGLAVDRRGHGDAAAAVAPARAAAATAARATCSAARARPRSSKPSASRER